MREPIEPGRRSSTIGVVAQLYGNVSRSAFDHDAIADAMRDRVVRKGVDAMATGRTLRRALLDRVSEISGVDEVGADLEKEWVTEARDLSEEARGLRALIEEHQRVLVGLDRLPAERSATLLYFSALWIEEAESIVDLMEDLAETLALSAHRPFRELVMAEIETARSP